MKRLDYEPALSLLAGLIHPHDIIVDAGANFGIYTLVLASRLSGGQVVAFEPGTKSLTQLRRNLASNPGLPVDVIPAALSDSNGSASLYHLGGPVTFFLGSGGPGASEVVRVTTLDAWAASAGLKKLDIMKVDVEGHEPAVFRGGRTVIDHHRPLIMFEVSRDALTRGGSGLDASWQILVGLGYDIFRLEAGRLHVLGEVEEGNLFAVHPQSSVRPRLAGLIESTA